MLDLDKAITDRHSVRKFLTEPVPRALLNQALALAQLAPSNSNIQPWRLFIAEGPRRDRLKEALLAEAQVRAPDISPLPDAFKHHRQELGAQVYGAMGIGRGDKEARQVAVLRNYEFFGAPTVAIICMHSDLGPADAVSVGMYLQTLVLGLTARGLGTCVEVSLFAYPNVIRKELGVPNELNVLCGLAIGYEDPEFPANRLHIGRQAVETNVVILDT